MDPYGDDFENEEAEGWDDEDEYDDPILENQISESSLAKVKDYKVLQANQIEKRQEKVIENVKELFGLDEDDAITALKYYNWNQERLEEQWFENPDKTQKKCGLVPDKSLISLDMDQTDLCYICYGPLQKGETDSMSCKHNFCKDCWLCYFKGKLQEGYHCVFSTCPYFKCPLTVTHSIWKRILSGSLRDRYMKFHCQSYTDDAKNIKWCPRPGCVNCIENLSYVVTDVECDCGHVFCFKCNQDTHQPCDCEVARKWLMKNKSESENITWMIANTKNCPKCQRPIEKNQGCNHMTCQMCKYEFCWMCMGDWTKHGSATGGYYKCNKYEAIKSGQTPEDEKDAELTKIEAKREKAKHELKKYMFFYERFSNHDKAGEHAKELEPKIKMIIEKLNVEKSYPIAELDFLNEALQEVIRCRKVLKWTYGYGFYLEDEKEKALFEDAQEQLEKNADHLHELIERDFEPFLLEEELDKKPFYQYKSQLVTCYKVTKQFYENLLAGLESGLTKQN